MSASQRFRWNLDLMNNLDNVFFSAWKALNSDDYSIVSKARKGQVNPKIKISNFKNRNMELYHLQSLSDIIKHFSNSFSPELFYTYIILSKTNIGGNILVIIHKYSFFSPLLLFKPILNTFCKIFIKSFQILDFRKRLRQEDPSFG